MNDRTELIANKFERDANMYSSQWFHHINKLYKVDIKSS